MNEIREMITQGVLVTHEASGVNGLQSPNENDSVASIEPYFPGHLTNQLEKESTSEAEVSQGLEISTIIQNPKNEESSNRSEAHNQVESSSEPSVSVRHNTEVEHESAEKIGEDSMTLDPVQSTSEERHIMTTSVNIVSVNTQSTDVAAVPDLSESKIEGGDELRNHSSLQILHDQRLGFSADVTGVATKNPPFLDDLSVHNSINSKIEVVIPQEKNERRSLTDIIEDQFMGFAAVTDTENSETLYSVDGFIVDDPELHWAGTTEDVRDESYLIDDIDLESSKLLKPTADDSIVPPSVPDSDEEPEREISTSANATINDSEYRPPTGSDLEETSRRDSDVEDQNSINDEESHVSADNSTDNTVPIVTGSIDNQQLIVQASKSGAKKHFCYYCHTLQSVISRHLENRHADQPEVQKFIHLPKRCREREKIIETIRNNGDYLFNKDAKLNNGQLIVSRRPKDERSASMYKVCHNCKGTFSAQSIRRHRQRCLGGSSTNKRSNTILSRRIEGRIHKDASAQLHRIFSVLREDDIVKLIRYDDIIIKFANTLCEKYRKQQYHDMIRSRLRTLGRLLKTMKELDNTITDFKSIYHPRLYHVLIKAVNKLAEFDPETGEHSKPFVVTSIGAYVTAVAATLKIDCIERVDDEQEKLVEKYLFLHKNQYSQKVNRIALESQAKKQQQAQKPLPTTEDIKKLSDYVVLSREQAYAALEKQYSYDNWVQLLKFTLISIQIFNRRRAGEIERALISDLKRIEKVNEECNPEDFRALSQVQKAIVSEYSRFMITGKLRRPVPVILDIDMENCLSLVLKFRSATKIPAGNPYLFGVPGFEEGRFKYLRACQLMRQFSKECGADHPDRLRGTYLRKHMATTCAAKNLHENEVVDIANFMGHAEAIHRSHYRRSVVTRDLIGVAKVLRSAMGDDEEVVAPNHENNQADELPQENDEVPQPIHSSTLQETEPSEENVPAGDQPGVLIPEEVHQTKPIPKKKARTLETQQVTFAEAQPSTSADTRPMPKSTIRKRKRVVSSESESPSSSESDEEPVIEKRSCNVSKKKTASTTSAKNGSKSVRKRWSDEEKMLAFSAFGSLIKNNQLPSTSAIKKFLKENPIVQRTVDQIRTWASNEKKKYNLGRTT